MNQISMKVTVKALKHINSITSKNQQQIAIKAISGDLSSIVGTLNKSCKVNIKVSNQLLLSLGDTTAIWRSHQETPEDFDMLFKMLQCKPDKEFIFPYVLIS